MNLREAAQMALEALQYPLETSSHAFDADKAELLSHRAIEALRAALAEPPCKTGASCTNKCPRCAEPERTAWFTVEELNEWASKLPQTTHWEGCEEVHPECRKPEQEVKNLADYEVKTYNIGGFHLPEGFYSAAELREMVKELDAMDAATKRSMRRMK